LKGKKGPFGLFDKIINEVDKMAEEKKSEEGKKKSLLEIMNETLQWFIFGGLLFGKGANPSQAGPSGAPQIEVPKIPAWLLSRIHLLSTEDEQEWDQILDSYDEDPTKQSIFFKFKNTLLDEGFDDDYLRLMLVNLNRDWLNRKDAKKTDIPNSAIIFIKQIVSMDGDYPAQRKLSQEKKFLKKTGGTKKAYLWHQRHKLETIVGIFILPIAFILFLLWLLGA
jgi:hypothetical protein